MKVFSENWCARKFALSLENKFTFLFLSVESSKEVTMSDIPNRKRLSAAIAPRGLL